jgi:hypothetical protein
MRVNVSRNARTVSQETLEQRLDRLLRRNLPGHQQATKPQATSPRWQLVRHGRTIHEADRYSDVIAQRDRRCSGRHDCREKGIGVRQNPALAYLTYGELVEAMKA